MRTGQSTPWGAAEHVQRFGPEVDAVCTPSHGGLRIGEGALAALPAGFREALITPGWAEEDCEMPIATVLLHDSGHIDTDDIGGGGVEKLRETAIGIIAQFPSYEGALEALRAGAPAAHARP